MPDTVIPAAAGTYAVLITAWHDTPEPPTARNMSVEYPRVAAWLFREGSTVAVPLVASEAGPASNAVRELFVPDDQDTMLRNEHAVCVTLDTAKERILTAARTAWRRRADVERWKARQRLHAASERVLEAA